MTNIRYKTFVAFFGVNLSVFGRRKYLQILGSVVRFKAIFVMHMLVFIQRTSKHFSGNEPMFKNAALFICHWVSMRKFADVIAAMYKKTFPSGMIFTSLPLALVFIGTFIGARKVFRFKTIWFEIFKSATNWTFKKFTSSLLKFHVMAANKFSRATMFINGINESFATTTAEDFFHPLSIAQGCI